MSQEPEILTPTQGETLRAVSDVIVPPDEWPGAGQAGALACITHLLATDAHERHALIAGGLDGLESEAQFRYGQAFVALAPQQQATIFTLVESGDVIGTWAVAPRPFVWILVQMVQESFYADPRNGGNHDAVSWQMIGFKVTA